MNVSRSRLPGKRSRTSTHATRVPNTALTAATPSPARIVSLRAAHASGVVMVSQKPETPLSNARKTMAASGMSTMMLRYIVARPRPMPVPRSTRNRDGCTRRGGIGGCSSRAWRSPVVMSGRSLGCRHTLALLDLDEETAGGIEELLAGVRPPAELVDCEQARRSLELVLARHAADDGTVAVVGEDLLRLLRVREPLALLLGEDRLVLVGQDGVTLPARKGLE